ncbi:MAG: hypothetical protein U1B30_06585 [Pseudomonadota bacterium]|nr:hypothetical protein [Pseudomonadota bacterium]
MSNMDLNTAKNFYFTRSDMLNRKHEELATTSFGFTEIFTRKNVTKYRSVLKQYYTWLYEYDEVLSKNMSLNDDNNELQPRTARANMVIISRSVYISSIESYEKELSNIESNLNFRLTTAIAVLALVFSAVGIGK